MMGQGYVSGVVHPPPNPSLKGRGLFIVGEGDFAGDDLQDAFGVHQHIIVPEADQAVAVGFDGAGAVRVRCALGVLPAIAFDRNPQAAAGEIDDVAANRELPRGLCAAKLSGAQMRPQMPFGIGHIAAQFARNSGQSLFSHLGTPIPNPFPSGKGLVVAVPWPLAKSPPRGEGPGVGVRRRMCRIPAQPHNTHTQPSPSRERALVGYLLRAISSAWRISSSTPSVFASRSLFQKRITV